MASTPPLQLIATPSTPQTPLHGAAYDRPVRKSSRIRQKASNQTYNNVLATPRRPRAVTSPQHAAQPPQTSLSPQSTPRKVAKRVQIISPSSPNTQPTPQKAPRSSAGPQPFSSSTTVLSEGMLPTPVKTPKKKNISDVKEASRALFQDPATIEEMSVFSPRKGRKTKRYNGFSLESFRTAEGDSNGVEIFTDNRDKIPQVDGSPSNPFIDVPTKEDASISQKVAGTTKRRKVSSNKYKDPQVEAALHQDEGMVYVFRGKKVYRRFNDSGEDAEEEIDPDDIGLVDSTAGSSRRERSMKTLTRKSIKPTRLFQTPEQQAAREREKEEEVATDVEERFSATDNSTSMNGLVHKSVKSTKPAATATEKKTSPFDTWPRLKKSGRDSSTSKAGKRIDSDALESPAEQELAKSTPKRKTRA